MRELVSVLATLACLASSHSRAQDPREQESAWQPIDAAAFESRLASCPATVRATVAASRDEHADEVSYAEHSSWIRRSSQSWGDGIDGATMTEHHLVELVSCFETRLHEVVENSSLFQLSVSMSESRAPAPRAWAELALGMPLETLTPSDPRHALPRLLTALRERSAGEQNIERSGCPPAPSAGPSVSQPLMPAQPWHAGAPRAAPAVWSAGHVTIGTDAPRPTWRGQGTELWEVALPSRYGATAVAQYDARLDRHRWLLVTRECVVGPIEWLGVRAGWMVAVVDAAPSDHAPELAAFHFERGEVRRVWWPFLGDDDGLPRAYALCGRPEVEEDGGCLRVTLRGGRLRAAVCFEGDCDSGSFEIGRLLSDVDRERAATHRGEGDDDE